LSGLLCDETSLCEKVFDILQLRQLLGTELLCKM